MPTAQRHAYIQESTHSLRLPRFRNAETSTRARTADFSHRAKKSSCFSCLHDALRPPRKTIPSDTPHTLLHACHAKRTLSNVKIHDSSHLPRGSTLQHLPRCRHASGTPRLPMQITIAARPGAPDGHRAHTLRPATTVMTVRDESNVMSVRG